MYEEKDEEFIMLRLFDADLTTIYNGYTNWIDYHNRIQGIYLEKSGEKRMLFAVKFYRAFDWNLDKAAAWLTEYVTRISTPPTPPTQMQPEAVKENEKPTYPIPLGLLNRQLHLSEAVRGERSTGNLVFDVGKSTRVRFNAEKRRIEVDEW